MALTEFEDDGLKQRAERVGALAVYGLLIAAPFTLGALAILAVIIAYFRRGGAGPLARSHYDYQIRSFWIDMTLVVLGVACGWASLATGLGTVAGLFGIQLPQGMTAGDLGWTAIALAIAWLVLWIWGFLGLFLGSVHGSMRLAASRPMGKTRRP